MALFDVYAPSQGRGLILFVRFFRRLNRVFRWLNPSCAGLSLLLLCHGLRILLGLWLVLPPLNRIIFLGRRLLMGWRGLFAARLGLSLDKADILFKAALLKK